MRPKYNEPHIQIKQTFVVIDISKMKRHLKRVLEEIRNVIIASLVTAAMMMRRVLMMRLIMSSHNMMSTATAAAARTSTTDNSTTKMWPNWRAMLLIVLRPVGNVQVEKRTIRIVTHSTISRVACSQLLLLSCFATRFRASAAGLLNVL